MPVNYLLVENNLDSFSKKTKHHRDQLNAARKQLSDAYQALDQSSAAIRSKIEKAESLLKSLYCAKPTGEPLLFSKNAPPAPESYTLVAADGSQINPNRHRSLQFCVINVGLIKLLKGSGKAPEIEIQSRLLDFDQLYTDDGSLVGEDMVALFRDHAERKAILEFTGLDKLPIITLTDGPLDVYLGMNIDQRRKDLQEEVFTVNRHLEARGVISAGFIDKPGSEMLSRMLSVFNTPEEKLASYDDKQRPVRGVPDAELLAICVDKPGQRSAVFEAVSKNPVMADKRIPVCFFYLNVSQGEKPWLVRVEFPVWVSKDPELVDLLHSVVYAETQILDTHPYPYLLHRSHELAVISMAEADAVEGMLLQQLDADGLSAGCVSNKEANKSLTKGDR
ncbi:MAG: DNA double-strand break repair nuclease NurA [Anaerolineaceae bacterium]